MTIHITYNFKKIIITRQTLSMGRNCRRNYDNMQLEDKNKSVISYYNYATCESKIIMGFTFYLHSSVFPIKLENTSNNFGYTVSLHVTPFLIQIISLLCRINTSCAVSIYFPTFSMAHNMPYLQSCRLLKLSLSGMLSHSL